VVPLRRPGLFYGDDGRSLPLRPAVLDALGIVRGDG
jgi:hypothetical protein